MTDKLNIGALARAAKIPTTTVRYYERIGLLQPAGRTFSNYRWYDQACLRRLQFIRAAQLAGFSLTDVARLLELEQDPGQACGPVQAMIAHRLRGVDHEILRLTAARKHLAAALRACLAGQPHKACAVLNRLHQSFAPSPSPSPSPKMRQ